MKYDVAVLGAGIAGLSASLVLARRGLRVALVEKESRPATLVRGFERRGLHFDTGFHYAGGLGEGDILDLFCRYLGLADRLVKVPLDPEGFDVVRCLRPQFEFRFPCGQEALRQRLHAAFPREGKGIDDYLQQLEEAAVAFPLINLEAAAPPMLLDGPTLQEMLDRTTGDRRLQAVLSIHTLLHGSAPQQVPFALHAAMIAPYYRGAHTLQGGGRSLAEAFDVALAEQGVDLFCGEGAEAILLRADGAVDGIRLSGGRTVTCAGCISTVHPRTLLALMPEAALRPVYRRRLLALEETPSAILLFGAGEGLPDALERSNHFLLPDPASVGRMEEPDLADGPLYVTTATPLLENRQAQGYLAIAPMAAGLGRFGENREGRRRPVEYPTAKAELVRKMQEKIALFLPGWRSAWAEGATPLTLRDYAHSPFGSLYGVKHRVGQYNPQARTRVPGLWLAGQATAAPGVMGAMISAFLACGEIVGHEQLRKELRACR